MVRRAEERDIPAIEAILLDAVAWLDGCGQSLWARDAVSWARLSQSFTPGDFCLALANGEPAGCMALIDFDPMFWPDLQKGESLFIHKLAVVRACAGKGVSKELLDFAKDEAKRRGIGAVRLDCHQHRQKLRAVYERNGFVCVAEKAVFGKYGTAFYVFDLPVT